MSAELPVLLTIYGFSPDMSFHQSTPGVDIWPMHLSCIQFLFFHVLGLRIPVHFYPRCLSTPSYEKNLLFCWWHSSTSLLLHTRSVDNSSRSRLLRLGSPVPFSGLFGFAAMSSSGNSALSKYQQTRCGTRAPSLLRVLPSA